MILINRRVVAISFIMSCIIFTGSGLNILVNDFKFKSPQFSAELDNLYESNGEKTPVIVFFNSSSYNLDTETRFLEYGGVINNQRKWNSLFNEFSGFAGIFPLENVSDYKSEFPNSNIEKDELLRVQMNYAAMQSQAVNSTWFSDGYKGDTNSSIAVLDSGINPDQAFLNGKISGWDNFINNDPISDDNGHGTFISSVIAGTGTRTYDSIVPSITNLYGNYSHLELFDEFIASKNYSLKIASLNLTEINSLVKVNSICIFENDEIDKMWFQLYYNTTLVNSTLHLIPNTTKELQYKVLNRGIYDLVLKYHKKSEVVPNFSYNASISFFPEPAVSNFNHFTGIANETYILSYKIVNQSGLGYSSDLISALYHVIQNREIKHIVAVCLSIGTIGEAYIGINRVIDEVVDNNILVVIAAGNYGIEGSDPLNKLAINKNCIVVGSTNDIDQVSSYSSMGKNVGGESVKPDIVAPGGSYLLGHRSIISADYKTNETTVLQGTSISTAIVSAAINILIEAKWGNWTTWNAQNLSKWAKTLKAILLMTATETNLEREDNPKTPVDESNYSPSSFNGLIDSLKDFHEGYGRLNIQAAVDALTRQIQVGSIINGHLTSSSINPLGKHIFARKIRLNNDFQYQFNLSNVNQESDFDMFLFSNSSNQYGEPILLESTQKWYGKFDSFFFTPKENETECILIVKANDGESDFSINISLVDNFYTPELKISEITYIGGVKNGTIISQQEFFGNSPLKNYSIDRYLFYIDYFDADASNVPPQDVLVHILENSKNYSLSQLIPTDNNYTDGAQFRSSLVEFTSPGVYHYYFSASDGAHNIRFPSSNNFSVIIEFPTDSESFPYSHSFNEGLGNWYFNGTGWGILTQSNSIDNRSQLFENDWSSVYFGREHNYPTNYTYQPYSIEDPYPNGTLFSPLFNLTHIDSNFTHPFAKFGLRTSLNSGDLILLQINLNWTGWITLNRYTNQQKEWFMDEFNLTEYIGNYVQFRFLTDLDVNFDTINYEGLMLDYFELYNYSNRYTPQYFFNINQNIYSFDESRYSMYEFSCNYFDKDGNYPEFVFLEINNNNYSLINAQGNWNVSSELENKKGVIFIRSLPIHDFSNQSFRFHIYDGKFLNTSEWFNPSNDLFGISIPTTLQYNTYINSTLVGYQFSNYLSPDFYLSGIPIPSEQTAWLKGDNTWHTISRFDGMYIYGGIAQNFGGLYQGYSEDWDAKLISHPLQLISNHKVYLQYYYDISLQNEFAIEENELDFCSVSISQDFGETWEVLKKYNYDDDTLSGNESIDLSKYENEIVMIMFTLHTNNVTIGLGSGWLLSDIYIGFDKNTDFINPEITFLKPDPNGNVNSVIEIQALITDNINIDTSRIYLYLNDKLVTNRDYDYNTNTGIFTYMWDTTYSIDGSYKLRIVAFDEEGNRAEQYIIVSVENGIINWHTWIPWFIVIIGTIIVGIVLFILADKKGKIRIKRMKNNNAETLRIKDIDKDQVIKRIEIIESEYIKDYPLTLHCKYCGSWFESKKFDYICPVCER
ncbi:MAG: S8 family serine peptidase [Candidatus Lokiarchaeota archaeon]